MARRLALIVLAVALALPGIALAQEGPPTTTPSQNQRQNNVNDWCEDGVKIEPVSTPFVVPEPPSGATWTLLVLKAGTTNETVVNPVVGQAYFPSNDKDISHVILCYEEDPPTTTTTTTTTTIPDTSTTTTIPEETTTTTVPDTSTTSTTWPTIIDTGEPLAQSYDEAIVMSLVAALSVIMLAYIAVRFWRLGRED